MYGECVRVVFHSPAALHKPPLVMLADLSLISRGTETTLIGPEEKKSAARLLNKCIMWIIYWWNTFFPTHGIQNRVEFYLHAWNYLHGNTGNFKHPLSLMRPATVMLHTNFNNAIIGTITTHREIKIFISCKSGSWLGLKYLFLLILFLAVRGNIPSWQHKLGLITSVRRCWDTNTCYLSFKHLFLFIFNIDAPPHHHPWTWLWKMKSGDSEVLHEQPLCVKSKPSKLSPLAVVWTLVRWELVLGACLFVVMVSKGGKPSHSIGSGIQSSWRTGHTKALCDGVITCRPDSGDVPTS